MSRVVLITGAAGGIGRATASVFQAAGWSVVAVDRVPAGGFPEGVQFRQADVANPDSIEALFAWLTADVGRLDALVNNAAVQICKPIVTMTTAEWDDLMASNLRSIFLTAKNGYPLLKASRGAVVNVSSVHAVATSVDIAAYAASKGGSVALTRAMALEFAADGIRVNAVLPGAVDTPMLRAGLGRGDAEGKSIPERLENLARKTALLRVGRPAEIAQAILFLADGDLSSFITGQSLIIDGGATTRLSTE